MANFLQTFRFVPLLGLLMLTSVALAQEPVDTPTPDSLDIIVPDVHGQTGDEAPPYIEPQPERPAVSIGGPFGVIIGGNRGVRIGGPNGVQLGGGAGARFGGPYGVQFGGGEGVRIGPRTYGPDPVYAPINDAAYTAQPNGREAAFTTIHYPRTATQALQLRINGEDTQISPGETISLDGPQGFTLRIARPNGRYGFRRSQSPGNFVFVETRRGWTLAPADGPPPPAPAEETRPNAPSLELEAPVFEPLPAPDARPESNRADR
jgi:hypothetical protein